MTSNLDRLRAEIEEYAEQAGLALFYGDWRNLESLPVVDWDSQQFPDFRSFLQAARAADIRLVVFHQHEFSSVLVEEALEQLSDCELPAEECQQLQERLSELEPYNGSVCEVQLSFDHAGRVFLFSLRTDWYEEFAEIMDEIQLATTELEDDEGTIGGYYSNN
jgi:predicted TIM-barrel fold metal-dependent hydrolase